VSSGPDDATLPYGLPPILDDIIEDPPLPGPAAPAAPTTPAPVSSGDPAVAAPTAPAGPTPRRTSSRQPTTPNDDTADPAGDVRRGALLMTSGTLVSRLLGLLRGVVLLAAIGATGQVADAFSVANKLPNVLYLLLAGGALNAVLVPQVVRAYRRRVGQEYVDRLLTFGFVVLAAATVVLTAAAPLLVRLYADPCSEAQLDLATTFAYWCIPQMFFYGVYALLGQVLNARGSFGPYMWAPVVNNVVSIAGFTLFVVALGSGAGAAADWGTGRVALLAGSATAGIVAQALVLVPFLARAGVRYRPRWGLRGSGLGRAGQVAVWTFVGLAIGQLGYVAVSRVASRAPGAAAGHALGVCEAAAVTGVAGNAAYDYGFLVFMLPHSLVTVSLATALFTRLSAQAHDGDTDAVRTTTSQGIRIVGILTTAAAVAIAVLAEPVVRLVAWSAPPADVSAVATVVVAMVVGLPAFGAWSMCQRVYYAYEDARGMVPVQVVMAAIVAGGTVVGSVLAPPRWWVAGAGLSMSVSYVVGAVLAMRAISRRLGGADGARVLQVHVRAAVAAVVAGGVGWLVLRLMHGGPDVSVIGAAVQSLVVGVVIAAVYVGGLRLMRVSELAVVTATAGRLVGRLLGRPRGRRTPTRPPGYDAASPAGPGLATAAGGATVDEVGRGSVLAGRYRLDAERATSLPGLHVWSGRDTILDRPVVVRVLDAASSATALDGARRAALVSDPRLVRVLDVTLRDDLGYVVTEDVTGPTLAQLVGRRPLTADQARSVVGEAASALEAARRRGVHHLALRPSAVAVAGDGRVLVSGLALDAALLGRSADDARTTSRADAVDLVRVLYAALTGHWPGPEVTADGLPLAPVDEAGAPVPPGRLVEGVPPDLGTLCTVTLCAQDDGPHTPGEVERELEPWGDIRVIGVPSPTTGATGVAGPPGTTAGAAGLAGAAGAAGVVAASSTGPTRVVRHSVRDLFDEPSAGTNRPGTPPPAALGRTGSYPAVPPAAGYGGYPGAPAPVGRTASSGQTASGQVAGQTAGWAPAGPASPTGPATLPGSPFPARAHDPFDVGIPDDPADRRRGPSASLVVLVVLVLAVLLGLALAVRALLAGGDDGGAAAPTTSATSQETAATPGSDTTTAGESSPTAAPTGVPPRILGIVSIDPSDTDGEHEEAVGKAIDGDPSTYWFSQTYNRDDFAGFKDGVGLALTLPEGALVQTVTVQVNGVGGDVEIRDTDAANPSGGDLMASGPVETGRFDIDPAVTTDSIVVWFTQLPTNAAGQFRIEVTEITVS
jgi:murein biosynthesis integral membrane protein MurJ